MNDQDLTHRQPLPAKCPDYATENSSNRKEGRLSDWPFAATGQLSGPGWPEQPLRQQRSDDGELRLDNVPPGRYAIQVFQDSNGNGLLDQGRRGIPLEPVGLSSNPPLLNGKPTPADSVFEHGTADTQLHIRLQSPKAKQ